MLQPPSHVAWAVGVWLLGCAGAVLGQDLLLPTTGVWGCNSQLLGMHSVCVWLGENSGEMRTTEIVLLGRWWGSIK